MQKIKQSWTYRHVQLITIVGLSLGIGLAHVDFRSYMPQAEAVVYLKAEEPKGCDLDCEIEQRTLRIFEENKNNYLEQARLDALQEMGDVIFSKMDNSPYIDYQAMAEQYGYSE